jgi:alpha-beta hydrolase superfamily lysophospholipase
MKKKLGWIFLIGIVIMNAVAYMHAYRFTHFSKEGVRTNPDELGAIDKLGIIMTGVKNPRPTHKSKPDTVFKTIVIKSDLVLEGWQINIAKPKGTIIMFHGYSGEKSSLLSRAVEFRKIGYNTLLVDFKGSGGSEGNSTTIGFDESQEVIDCVKYLRYQGENNIHLFGTSMGAAAILKALHEQDLTPTSIILECPFGRLDQTVAARFRVMGIPAFPLSDVLTFWGGVQNGYWAFAHNPQEYAKGVHCPALLIFGEKDDRVSREETNTIFKNLSGEKQLATYPEHGHALFTSESHEQWITDVSGFIKKVESTSTHHSAGSE